MLLHCADGFIQTQGSLHPSAIILAPLIPLPPSHSNTTSQTIESPAALQSISIYIQPKVNALPPLFSNIE